MTPKQEREKIAAESNVSLADKARELRAYETMEREANQFAMELLMPRKFVEAELAKAGRIDMEDEIAIARLAKKFKVSVPIMTIRLGQIIRTI